MNDKHLEHILSMLNSRIGNYVIPGLSSSLVGGEGRGMVRMFECSRDHEESITAHSHRFDLLCIVLRGKVWNTTWTKANSNDEEADEYHAVSLDYLGDVGEYRRVGREVSCWKWQTHQYKQGDEYFMKADEVHSICFSRGAKVLCFEGPTVSDKSIALLPYVDGETIDTMTVQPWMFKKEKV